MTKWVQAEAPIFWVLLLNLVGNKIQAALWKANVKKKILKYEYQIAFFHKMKNEMKCNFGGLQKTEQDFKLEFHFDDFWWIILHRVCISLQTEN